MYVCAYIMYIYIYTHRGIFAPASRRATQRGEGYNIIISTILIEVAVL